MKTLETLNFSVMYSNNPADLIDSELEQIEYCEYCGNYYNEDNEQLDFDENKHEFTHVKMCPNCLDEKNKQFKIDMIYSYIKSFDNVFLIEDIHIDKLSFFLKLIIKDSFYIPLDYTKVIFCEFETKKVTIQIAFEDYDKIIK